MAFQSSRACFAPVIGGLLIAAASAAAAAQAAPARDQAFALPARPLPDALIAFSRQTNIVVIAPSDLVRDHRAAAVTGRMSPSEALARMLRGGDLDFRIAPDGVVTIIRRAAPTPTLPPAARDAPPPIETITLVSPLWVTVPGRETTSPLALKRASTAQIDLVEDDDLRQTPDLGLAEAMQSLPGVAVVGEGDNRQIAVRGLAGQFTRVRINGMEALATYGGANPWGGTNRGRAFDYNVFASDLFRQIRLQKTASADVDEGSLGATVDLRTRSPFDGKRESLTLVAEGTYGAASDSVRPRVSAILSRRLLDNRLGVLVSAAYSERRTTDTGSTAGQWQTGDTVFPGFGSAADGLDLAAINAALHPRIPRLELFKMDQKRLGLTGALHWRPSDRTQVSLDVLYSELSSRREEYLLETFTFRTAGACAAASAGACGLNGVRVLDATIIEPRPGLPVLIAGAFDNVDVKSEARLDALKTVFRQTTLSATHRLRPDLTLTALVGYSRSDFSNPKQETLHLDQAGVSGFRYDFSDRDRPYLGFGDADLTSPSVWTLSELRSDPNWVDNRFKTASLDVEWISGPSSRLRGGVAYKAYSMAIATLSRSVGTIANVNNDIPLAFAAIPVSTYAKRVSSGRLAMRDGTPDAWLAPDVARAVALFRAACLATACDAFDLGPEPVLSVNHDLWETDTSAYLQWSFGLGGPLRGDAGLRVVRTDQRAEGQTLTASAEAPISPVRARRAYHDLLPSLNLVYEAAPSVLLRFGAAKVMARPDLRSLRPGVTVSIGGMRAASAGNPDLQPSRGTTLDASVEWYFAPDALLALAVFHKSLASTIQSTITSPDVFSRNPFGLPDSLATTACGFAPGCAADLPIWQFIKPTNGKGGRIDGVELALEAPLTALGVRRWTARASMTYAGSRLRYRDTAGVERISHDALGGPRFSSNLNLIYRGKRLEARGAASYRGRYLRAIPAPTGGDVDGVSAGASIDASARYRLAPTLWLTAEGVNLTNAAQRQFTDSSEIPNYLHHTGREFRLGMTWRF